MQEGAVGWDPISINHHLPWQAKVFILYLFVVTVISIVRSVRLTWQLWFVSSRERVPTPGGRSQADKADAIADLALAGRFQKIDQLLAIDAQQDRRNSFLTDLRGANNRFVYMWDICMARVAAMKRMAALTLVLALLMFTDGVTINLKWIAESKYFGPAAITGGLAEVSLIVSFGILVCALLHGLASFYQGVLTRRAASWRYFRADASEQGDDES